MYGANRSLLVLIRQAREAGINPSLIVRQDLTSTDVAVTEKLEQIGVPYVAVPIKHWMSEARWKAPARLGVNLAFMPFLALKLSQWNTDLIHTNSSVSPVGAMLSVLTNRPHVWHIREFGDLDYDLEHDWGRTVFEVGLRTADALIAVSKAVRRHVLAGLEEKTDVIYNGVVSREQLQTFRAKPLSPEDQNDFVFSLLGRIRPNKGHEHAIRAMHHLREDGHSVRLLVAGDGKDEYERYLRRLSEKLGVQDRVEFLGFVDQPFRVYRKSHAVLMCSANEAMGRVTAEAMACARPVVGIDRGGTSELIDDREHGLLCGESPEELAAAMKKLVSYPEWAQSLGERGQQKAERCFTEEVYAQRVFGVYRRASSGWGTSPE
jgi:glycosyltransferase involved in cell wall biosynthesis